MNKKLLALLTASIVCAALLAGCGKEKEAAPEIAETKGTEEAVTEEPQKEPPAQETSDPEEAEIVPEDSSEKALSIDEAISKAIFDRENQYSEGEAFGEGHILMDSEEGANGSVICYTLTKSGWYEFQDGNFVFSSGSGVIPAVMAFVQEGDGSYTLNNYEVPMDGSGFVDSVKDLFPEKYWSRCITIEEDDRAELERQERSYIEEYLESIGRQDAEIGEFGDYEHPLATDLGLSEDIDNMILDVTSQDSFEQNCPFWFGEREVLEENIRYIYKTEYDKKKNEIIFSKSDYESGEVLESSVYSSKTGEKKQ